MTNFAPLAPSARSISGLLTMLTYQRPAWSKAEEDFIARFLDVVPGMHQDSYGNRWLVQGTTPILWSCHTDTVHKSGGRQRVSYGDGVVTADDGANCLGADDTAGVWIMLKMIKAGVPGTYVFHRAEETGGQGSAWIAKHMASRLERIKWAIALDRAGTGDVITEQWGGRCCSDAFALALADKLRPLHYSPGHGTFTDTANYVDIIPECTNLSIGYYKQHSAGEWLDVRHLVALKNALITAQWDDLPVDRVPGQDVDMAEPDLAGFVWDDPDTVAAFLDAMGFTVEDLVDFRNANKRR